MIEENIKVDTCFYDKDGEEKVIKNCELINDFMYARNNFFLTKKGCFFFVNVSKNGDLLSVWSYETDNMTASEVMSLFRRKFQENNIDGDKLELFINDPLKYKNKHNTTKKGLKLKLKKASK